MEQKCTGCNHRGNRQVSWKRWESGKCTSNVQYQNSDCAGGVRWYGAQAKWWQVAVISTQVIGIWWAGLTVTVTPLQYPLHQGRFLTPDCRDRGGHGLWEQGGLGGSGGILRKGRYPEHCPGLPMIVPLARIPPNQWSTPGDHPNVESLRCSVPGRWLR